MDIDKITREMTREEILSHISDNGTLVMKDHGYSCPTCLGLTGLYGPCYRFDSDRCKVCWEFAIKDIKFKDEPINERSEQIKKAIKETEESQLSIKSETRRDKTNYYLDIAETVLERSTCIRRKYGAVIVKDDEIVSTGYTGAPRGEINCCDAGFCERESKHIPHGSNYELCKSVHAEMNAIISASRKEMIGSTLYLVGVENMTMGLQRYVKDAKPCDICRRLIINAGIKQVITRVNRDEYSMMEVK